MPDFTLERQARARGYCRVAGVDEVGRGPFAGPVVAAAVVLNPDAIPTGLRDSKRLTAARRETLAGEIARLAEVSIGQCSVSEIDEINILGASMLAMRRALDALAHPVDYALIDGNRLPRDLSCPADAVVKGDGKVCSIAAASIVAKVYRDRLMCDLAAHFPGYGWEKNAGYGTKQHIAALNSLGVTPHHRRSFKPIHNILYQDK